VGPVRGIRQCKKNCRVPDIQENPDLQTRVIRGTLKDCNSDRGVANLPVSHLRKDYRPWKTIGAELSQEFDPQKVGALADELDAAMLAQSTPLIFRKIPTFASRTANGFTAFWHLAF